MTQIGHSTIGSPRRRLIRRHQETISEAGNTDESHLCLQKQKNESDVTVELLGTLSKQRGQAALRKSMDFWNKALLSFVQRLEDTQEVPKNLLIEPSKRDVEKNVLVLINGKRWYLGWVRYSVTFRRLSHSSACFSWGVEASFCGFGFFSFESSTVLHFRFFKHWVCLRCSHFDCVQSFLSTHFTFTWLPWRITRQVSAFSASFVKEATSVTSGRHSFHLNS